MNCLVRSSCFNFCLHGIEWRENSQNDRTAGTTGKLGMTAESWNDRKAGMTAESWNDRKAEMIGQLERPESLE